MRDAEVRIAAMVSEAHRIGDLDTLAAWLQDNLPGPFAHLPEVWGSRGIPPSSKLSGARFFLPVYFRDISHMKGKAHMGLPLSPPGERTQILGYRVALEIRTEGGNWWHPAILQRLGMFPSPCLNEALGKRARKLVYDVIMRGDDWTSFAVMQRLKDAAT